MKTHHCILPPRFQQLFSSPSRPAPPHGRIVVFITFYGSLCALPGAPACGLKASTHGHKRQTGRQVCSVSECAPETPYAYSRPQPGCVVSLSNCIFS
jgi:hypothetical protein